MDSRHKREAIQLRPLISEINLCSDAEHSSQEALTISWRTDSGDGPKRLRLSGFMGDLVATVIAQTALVGLSLVLMRLLATLVTEEDFGVFMVIRRVVAVMVPVTSLNLGVGLARFLAYQVESRRAFISAALWVVVCLTCVVALLMLVGKSLLSSALFGSGGFEPFVVITAITLLGTNLLGLVSDVYRGRVEMKWANLAQVMSAVLPLVAIVPAWLLSGGVSTQFLESQLLLSAGGMLLVAWGLYRFGPAWTVPMGPAVLRSEKAWTLFAYSIVRVPSGFLLGLVFGLPVFAAASTGNLDLAARLGILATLIRLMETWVYPFNLIVLPRFASLQAEQSPEAVRAYAELVLDFVVRALPLIGTLTFGLAGALIHLAFGAKYIDVSGPAAWMLLASTAYVCFVLIRGILDGLYGFPFVNVVAVAGLVTSGACALLFGHESLPQLVMALASSMAAMGATSIFLLVRTTRASVSAEGVISGIFIAFAGLLLAGFLDRFLLPSGLGALWHFGLQSLIRGVILLVVFSFHWRKRSDWGKAIFDRMWRT